MRERVRVRARVRVRGLGEDDPANNWLQLHKPTVLFQIKEMLSEWSSKSSVFALVFKSRRG